MSKVLTLVFSLFFIHSGAQTIDLSGTWKFATGDTPAYNDEVTLPGSMLTNGKGDEVSVNTQWVGSLYDSSFFFNPYMEKYRVEGNMKFPFFLTPDKHYVGKAWYGRTITIPKSWRGKRIFLYLERPHIESNVYINGRLTGRDSSLSVPHEYEITDYVKAGKENSLDILIYNGIENVCVGQDSHSVTDQTQGDWNGIIGDISLRARPKTFISNVQVFPDVAAGTLRVEYDIDGTYGGDIELSVFGRTYSCRDSITIGLPDDVELWSEFTPSLYTLTSVLKDDTVVTSFGVRDFTIDGRQFYVNGRKVWLRGTVENCCFPLTGYPPTDMKSWMDVFRKCKEYGLNMVRFHSYCPPEAAFTAADIVGIYLQPEGPSWPNHGVRLGRGMSIDKYLLEETRRMVEKYGNHPSFCMLAAGNEPAGDWVTWVDDFIDYWKSTGDHRRVYCGASVGGGWAFDPKSEYHVKGGARGLTWDKCAPQSTDDFYSAITQFTQKGRQSTTVFDINEPYVAHELGQWCAFPDLNETSQYTGVYKAANFDIFADLLAENGMATQAEKFLHASGKLQTLCYKYDIERNLRTPDYAGFQMLSINDYSGQGTALVGVLNVFWQEKSYCTSNDWTQFCAPVVPLAKFPRFICSSCDTLEVDVELYNASDGTLTDAAFAYSVSCEDGDVLASGPLCSGSYDVGKNIGLGHVAVPLNMIDEPQKLTLSISCSQIDTDGISNPDIKRVKNSWDFWVYPPVEIPEENGIYITDTLDTKAVETLTAGGKVLIIAGGKISLGSDVVQTYLPVFWNTSWFKMRPPHTTGAYIDTSHALFKHFPTDDWTNINWWELVNNAQVMNLQELPADYQSPVQPIDTWHISRKLGMIVEANVSGGKLLITTMDINSNLDTRLVAKQMRKAIIDYMSSDEFNPSLTTDINTISHFFTMQSDKVEMFTKQTPDELKPTLK